MSIFWRLVGTILPRNFQDVVSEVDPFPIIIRKVLEVNKFTFAELGSHVSLLYRTVELVLGQRTFPFWVESGDHGGSFLLAIVTKVNGIVNS